jgi:Domain of unknown function (DUF397)
MTTHISNGSRADAIRGVAWHKSTRSNASGNCVELARLAGGELAVRNSRFPDGPALIFTREEARAFIMGARDGDFDFILD